MRGPREASGGSRFRCSSSHTDTACAIVGCLALLLGTPDPLQEWDPYDDAAPAREEAPVDEAGPHVRAGADEGEGYITDGWRSTFGEPRRFSWDFFALGGIRYTAAGELEEQVERVAPFWGFSTGPAFPTAPGQAISPGLVFLYSRIESDIAGSHWDAEQAGFNLRYLFRYTTRLETYLHTDITYTILRWDRPGPSSFSREGITAGLGFGAHWFLGGWFGLGAQGAVRYWLGDADSSATWFDLGFVVQARF